MFKIIQYKETEHIPLNTRRIVRTGIYPTSLRSNVRVRKKTLPYFWANVVDGRYFELCILCKITHGEKEKKKALDSPGSSWHVGLAEKEDPGKDSEKKQSGNQQKNQKNSDKEYFQDDWRGQVC